MHLVGHLLDSESAVQLTKAICKVVSQCQIQNISTSPPALRRDSEDFYALGR